ncbi:E3 ubiquitin- ligase RING1-like [Olea europaea subsp. europaea]|uniref:RING-type E3 ubiquitin transferase n=1 Tax=Olea europaea subsp. europaea TaxID=158383 RepID=A0A8S0U613_OLEEU|nr:E3 ubiquitin- ligase RING1-like [Olea europaea subsp. europaea]
MDSSESSPAPPSSEELTARGNTSFLLPWILTATATATNSSREIMVFVNESTESVTIVEGSGDVESILGEIPEKGGFTPASKASIESLPVVRITEPGLECPICLSEFEVNAEIKQMPCSHKFHSDCINKWLGIQGSCPFCRYKMPEEEKKEETNSDDETRRVGELRILMFLTGRRGSNRRNQESGHDNSSSDNRSVSGSDGNDGLSDQDM